MRVALKIDVDTFRGMREGLPRLLEILAKRRVRATVFVSMGPDHSGRAIRRIVRPGFLKKMFRTKAVSLYGPRTILYGTLWPGPKIARGNAELFRRIEGEGHEAGVHGWDHVRWQDGLARFDAPTIGRELEQAFAVFEEITGHRPRATAAPGWIANVRSLGVQDGLGLAYAADARGVFPFRPRAEGRVFATTQIPTTLPTLDELIGSGGGSGNDESWINDALVAQSLRQSESHPDAPVVHTLHTEVEGLSRAALFADLLDRWLAEGARFATLADVAAGSAPGAPICDLIEGTVPNRSGTLAVQGGMRSVTNT
jgi:peptidoglycan/xylan/chitin deacetylase (PgdA/CDA1 family)